MGGLMGRALEIRDDLGAHELRGWARKVGNGRASARAYAIANALDGLRRAEAARLRMPTVQRMEGDRGPLRSSAENILKVQNSLEDAGIAFIDESNELGPGVRFKRQEKG